MTGVYNIPAGVPFADALAQGILDQYGDNPDALAQIRIFLPTRRGCRTLRDTFLKLTEGKPLILPRMQPIGDVEEDDLFWAQAAQGEEGLKLPPALPSIKRRVLLTRLISRIPDFAHGPDQALALAGALGQLMDQIYTEDLSFDRLADLVPAEFADHWQITIEFLKILSEKWPEILQEHGVIDAADRRNRLIKALAKHWQDHPPQTPVIAAGSTGSIPSTSLLLQTIAGLPQGMVVLPGLDNHIDEKSWRSFDDTHPQATLRQLLSYMRIQRHDVKPWPHAGDDLDVRRFVATEVMRPADTADEWMALSTHGKQHDLLQQSLQNIRRFDCDTVQEEAGLIALLMRETLETPGRTTALITSDRNLARRVASSCRRWDIEVDDSAGWMLTDTDQGRFLLLTAEALAENFRPASLAALLKHQYCRMSYERKDINGLVNMLELSLLRGPKPKPGLEALIEKASEDEKLQRFLQQLKVLYADFVALSEQPKASFVDYFDAHLRLMEGLACRPDEAGAAILWQGDNGEALARFLAELREQAQGLPLLSIRDYINVLGQLMKTVTVRTPYGVHPRLYILGQLEARLVQADLVIMGGLNEGSWPPDPGSDPWMSRPMRKEFGLPSPERSVGLSAHDFVQGFCHDNVVLTRSKRVDGTPTVPARWLQRLDTVVQAYGLDPQMLQQDTYLKFVRMLDRSDGEPQPVKRPEPRPDVSARPESLSVTAIETWMRDPYALYARYVLGLRKLSPIEEQADAAIRGTIIHEVLDDFITRYPDELPANAHELLLNKGKEVLTDLFDEPRLWVFWWPRFQRLAAWFIDHEKAWRAQGMRPKLTEKTGQVDIDGFMLRAKADRIDVNVDGQAAIIDYKTGTVPSMTDVKLGYAPQLPLEALIVQAGGFEGLQADSAYLGFWKMAGGTVAGEEKPVKDDIVDLVENARAGLAHLIEVFSKQNTPYYSLPRPDKAPPAAWQDYAQLARVQEWVALDGQEEAA